MNRICSLADFYSYVDRHPYVSFDLFDTLICRRLLKVNEVHDTVSAYVLTQIGKRRTNNPFDLTLLRYRMTDLLKISSDGGNQEPLIDHVWDRLLRHEITEVAQRQAMVQRVVSFELELELCNLRLVPGAAELLAKLQNDGRTVVGISDMYFDMERMQTILRKLGILDLFAHLYVSADVQRTKQTGDLFRHVLADLHIKPVQMIHVGDNLRSDVEQATEVGIAAVLVDQPHLLDIKRPAYGRRARIEEEVADLVKMHLLSLHLDGQERRLDRIYFMARDGCAIDSFLTKWKPSLIDAFMPSPDTKVLYLNRILSCWGGIDFAGEWLFQAVELALWLNHNAATPEEVCAVLGLAETPYALGSRTLRAGHDTARIVGVFTEAKLVGQIKAEIIAKRAELVRYLEGIGFFNSRSVAFSDVGYSGTVLRDLNNLFLNRAAEEGVLHPPAMLLCLLATSDNLATNRPRSYPFVEFAANPVLPADKLPQELKASFAWLELFFKHPTLMPILRFIENDAVVVPEIRHELTLPDPVPSQRVSHYAVERDEDIVLLWMSALNFTAQIIDPIIDRFANPDPDTIAQMQDEVFEQHSIHGTRRSIFLTIPGARPEAISLAAQQGDYWIPGSIAVSRAAPHARHAPHEDIAAAPQQRQGLRRWFRSPRPVGAERSMPSPDSFDPTFYREFYADLRQFVKADELWNHYLRHGRAEKRLPTRQALIAQLEAEFLTIPADFDGRAYLRLNGDLGAQLDNPVQALNHYMRFGRHEGRKYLNNDPDLPQDFERLRATNVIILSASEEALWAKGEDTLTLFLRRHEVWAGSWLNDLNVAEFRALHHAWCGPVTCAAACIVALLEKGMARCPSLSLHRPFDANYYRRQSAQLEHLGPADLYRHYLNHSSREGLQPSEAAALRDLWGQSEFPDCFEWNKYRATISHLQEASRSAVLAAFIDDPNQKRVKFITGANAASFLEYLAVRAWRHHGRTQEAETLFEAALDAGASLGRIQHLLGDLALQLGQPDRALAHFRLGAQSADANLWSSFHTGRLLLEQGDYRSAMNVLAESAAGWQERAPWRRLWAAAMRARCKAVLRNFRAAADNPSAFDEADGLVDEIIAQAPLKRSGSHGGAGVLVITSRAITAPFLEPMPSSANTIVNLTEDDGGDLAGALLAHELVIFHETPFTYKVLRTIALAKSLGMQAVAWFGDLANWEGHPLCERFATTDTGPTALRLDNLPEFALPARYCDSIVTTLAGCAPFLQQIARDGDVFVVNVASGNCRGADPERRVVLVGPGAAADDEMANTVASAIVQAARDDAKLFFLVTEPMARRPALRAVPAQWEAIDNGLNLGDCARLIETVDAVLHLGEAPNLGKKGSAGYSVEAEAASRGVPATTIPASAPGPIGARKLRSADGTSAPDRAAEARAIATSIHRMVEGVVAPPMPQECHRQNAEHTQRTATAKPAMRILYANVFFAPQVIGGATRVLKDNVDYILDHHHEEFEIAVFTADEQNDRDGEWRIDAFRGVPVYRVATPQELDMDWRTDNPAVGAKFQAVLRAFKPDLVHIHCLQRLSVTVAEACAAASVPYIVTLHDAWWISDFPFLTNAAGMPVAARPDYYDQERLGRVGVVRSVLRAKRLRAALLGADRRLAVSESFAEIYRSAGIACETVQNGVSRIEPFTRATPGSRVEMCHIGGLQHHKGAYLIEAALRNGVYANLHFTVVDLARGPGEETQTIWGTTPVTIAGKMSTAQLAYFYSRMNVLLAPSTWPESYGLVSREALGHGLWVVASEGGGAMADPVIEGVNGFVLSSGDMTHLARVLGMIDRDAATYRLPPKVTENMRTADDQSRDLVELYWSMARVEHNTVPFLETVE